MQRLISVLSDLRTWLVLAFVHRLITITQAPLESAHNWRQAMMCMVARNFYEVDPNIFYPRIDSPGNLSGVTGMEFPLLNYLIYLVALVFDYDHWYGRLINLLISTLGIYAIYKYLSGFYQRRVVFATSIALLFSIYYYYSRKVMPDMFAVSLVFIGLWAWSKYVNDGRLKWLLFGVISMLFGVLSKLPIVAALPLIWPLIFQANRRQRVILITSLFLVGVLVAMWYFAWVPHLKELGKTDRYFMGSSLYETLGYLVADPLRVLAVFYQYAVGISGFLAMLVGLYFLLLYGLRERLMFISALLLVLVILFVSGDRFYEHHYYIIPFVPFMALAIGMATDKLKGGWFALVLVVISAEGIIRRWDDQFIKSGKEIVNLEEIIAPYVAKDQTIVVNSEEIPTPLYFAHRRGWVTWNQSLMQPGFREKLKTQGCGFVLVLKKRFGSEVRLPLPLELENDLLILYRLE